MTQNDKPAAPAANQTADSGKGAAAALPKVLNRRSFFTGLGMVAAAGAAVTAVKPAASLLGPADAADAATAEPEGDGYRLTEHVKKYYRTTTI